MNPFKKGDRVYHFVHGWGEVIDLDNDASFDNTRVQFDKVNKWLNHKELSFTEYEAPKVNHRRKVMIEVSEDDLNHLEKLEELVMDAFDGSIVLKEAQELTNRIKKALEND